MRKAAASLTSALCLLAQGVFAENEISVEKNPTVEMPAKPLIRPGVFVDTYYASSFYRPVSSDRQYLTQAARDREFNINLAHIEAVVDEKRIRGRLAVQFGTSVNANYQNESTTEKYSNQFSTRNLQEAFVGHKFFDKLWLDAGIFFGHIGLEPWISHSNWNYTRALNLDNVPYYATGVRLAYEATAKLALQLHILNGWQVITPANRDKSLGTQVSYTISPQLKIIHNTFAGNVAPDDGSPQYRFYSNLILEISPSRSWQFAITADVGAQKAAGNNSYRQWYAGAVYARYSFNEQWHAAIRLEYFIDPRQVMVATGTENGFQVAGSTLNLNFQPLAVYMLRLEYRNFFSRDRIYYFSDGVRTQEHIVTAAASLKL